MNRLCGCMVWNKTEISIAPHLEENGHGNKTVHRDFNLFDGPFIIKL